MTLSDNQMKQAKQLVEQDLIQELDSDHWLVSSVKGNGSYEVERVDQSQYSFDYYCKCQGWKFSKTKDCKHCEAVRRYQRRKK